ncbi:ScbR family autoregulator-binding transcription factor [Rhodococcus opacus]|uniref:ScbR family autoregulator-binding transcription factor n=1 Tax=Rhodococcus opacus TaxID=37919 RepID=UPI0006BB51C0|nr:ScbR family autoregulator-binding transcription factor [Rhodococcus opacus]
MTQRRAHLTRSALLQRAAEEFDRHGYVLATLNSISGKSSTTKGGLYFHFPTKEDLARAVIDEGFRRFERACAQRMATHFRALETLIDLSYVLAAYGRDDPLLRAAFRLLFEIGDYRGSREAPSIFETWTLHCRNLILAAGEEGDLRAGIDPDELAEVLVEMAYGARVLAAATGALDSPTHRITAGWALLLPTLTEPAAATYFRQFAGRRTPTTLSPRGMEPTAS